MVSPGQRRGSCGHVMAGFDLYKKCARCRDKKLGDDPCVKDKDCSVCDNLMEVQKSMLATPQYQIRKDKKSVVLVSPSKVTVVGPDERLLMCIPCLTTVRVRNYRPVPGHHRFLLINNSLEVLFPVKTLMFLITNCKRSLHVLKLCFQDQLSSPRPNYRLMLDIYQSFS